MNNRVKILVVEDSPTQAEQLRYILEQHEYDVSVAQNGVEAFAHIKRQKPMIVISDIMMPEMDGYELCKEIKADENLKNIAVILLTSLSELTDVIRGLECGADNFITKPYHEQFLLSRVRHILINKEIRNNGTSEMGIEVFFAGRKHYLNSERIQIIDLLLSTFENAIQQKIELEQSNRYLQKALETIKILEANYRSLLERNADAMVVVDRSRIVRYVNPAAEALFGRGSDTFLGKRFDFPVTAGETREVNIGQGNEVEVVAEMRVVQTNWEGESAYLASLRDVTRNVQLRENLRKLSLTDELTGLYNRRGFLNLAQQRLNATSQVNGAIMLLFIDLNDMKWINDTFGHQEGDAALIETAIILKETFRESDIIGRIGGDEFAILVLEAYKNSGEILTTRLQDNLDACNAQQDRRYNLSISIGITYYDPECPCSVTDLLNRADQLMYEQKRCK